MLATETAYAREIDKKYKIFSSHYSADEIDLEVNEYYAIIVDESEYDNRDKVVELNAPIVEYQKNELGNYYYLFLYSDYKSYIYELVNLQKKR